MLVGKGGFVTCMAGCLMLRSERVGWAFGNDETGRTLIDLACNESDTSYVGSQNSIICL